MSSFIGDAIETDGQQVRHLHFFLFFLLPVLKLLPGSVSITGRAHNTYSVTSRNFKQLNGIVESCLSKTLDLSASSRLEHATRPGDCVENDTTQGFDKQLIQYLDEYRLFNSTTQQPVFFRRSLTCPLINFGSKINYLNPSSYPFELNMVARAFILLISFIDDLSLTGRRLV